MTGLRIGIDVGGTFTHGVLLEPPGAVLASARVPTTHRAAAGVAQGIGEVLALLLGRLPAVGRSRDEIELVAHSTTQATNALLEGDLSGVHLLALYPPGEREAVAAALAARLLPLGGGNHVRVWPKLLCDWSTATVEQWPSDMAAGSAGPGSTRSGSAGQGLASAARQTVTGAPEKAADAGVEALVSVRGPQGSPALSSLPQPDWSRRAGVPDGWDSQGGVPPGFWVSEQLPVAIVQPLAGRHELREPVVAAHYRAQGHSVVSAAEITQVLGLAARARTAIINAAMLPTMLATADHTERSVRSLLSGTDGASVALQVVRSDGGAMSIDEMRRQPISALLSGPAAGASAALHRSGLSDFVFIEVGGTSTDITIVSDGRVRQRSAEVGGQRLLVPALELRTVAVGGGSMLRADSSLFGPRSAHIAGLPYLFQALQAGLEVVGASEWVDPGGPHKYVAAAMSDGSQAAFTLTDMRMLLSNTAHIERLFSIRLAEEELMRLKAAAEALGRAMQAQPDKARLQRQLSFEQLMHHGLNEESGAGSYETDPAALRSSVEQQVGCMKLVSAYTNTCELVANEVLALAKAQKLSLERFALVGGGGGAPTIHMTVASFCGLMPRVSLIADHTVISAIGAALAVTCVSLSRTVADPKASDIAELSEQVAERLRAQGSERVSTDYDYDPQRQVLTVTGRGNRPYAQDAQPHSDAQLAALAAELLGGSADIGGARQSLAISARQTMSGAPQDGRGQAHAPTGQDAGLKTGAPSGADLLWSGGGMQLWRAHGAADQRYGPPGRHPVGRPGSAATARGGLFGAARGRHGHPALALQHFGRVLWQGALAAHYPARGAEREAVLAQILARHTAWGDGGSELPGLALLAAGRLIPLEHLGSAELIAEVLRLEQLAAEEPCCFIVRG